MIETLEIPALMKLIILWGIQAVFIQEIFIECLVCAQHSSSVLPAINIVLMELMLLAFKIQSNKNCDGEVWEALETKECYLKLPPSSLFCFIQMHVLVLGVSRKIEIRSQ